MNFILYGGEKIFFEQTIKQHGNQKVLIKVYPNCRVVVSAPPEADQKAIYQAVEKRARWIYQQLSVFQSQQTHLTPRNYISGESYYYLGRQHVLKVIENPHETQNVKMLRGKLVVTVREKNPEKVRCLLNDWYKTRARVVFPTRLKAMLERTLWVKECPPIRLQIMQTQWGNCSPHGRLTLNPLLIKTPRECIDYVILHELCHLAEHNHSPRFYRLMTQVMPEWKRIKSHLDDLAAKVFQQ